MSQIQVTFSSQATAEAFATRWNLEAPTDSNVTVGWNLLPHVAKHSDAVSHTQVDTSTEHRYIVTGDADTIAVHSTFIADLGNGFSLVSSTTGVELAKVCATIDIASQGVAYQAVSTISSVNYDTEGRDLDPTSADAQWARIRVASQYRPLIDSYSMHDINYLSKPELYIMDSGIDFDHPEFDSASLEKDNFYALSVFNGDFNDDLGHGTSVSSMAVGKNLGITQHCKLRSIKIGGIVDGVKYTANLIDIGTCIDAILTEVATDPNKTRIVNMSWGITRSSWLDSKVESLLDAGVSVICAAGNGGISVEDISPAGIDNVITVGAIDQYDIPAGYNNISPTDSGLVSSDGLSLDIFAPGDEVCVPNGTDSYAYASGTSFASPMVAGVAVLIGSMNDSSVFYSDMKDSIMSTATENALLFEDDRFSENQNRLVYVVTADPLVSYKNNNLVSYVGVSENEPIVINLESNLTLGSFKTLYPDDVITFSIEFVDPAIEAKYSPYVICDPETGTITINPATGVTLAEEIKLEMVEFIGKGSTPRVTVVSNTIFYFNSNPDYADTLNSDVTLALTDINSISFFSYWSQSIK